jgi:hypothetical protein
MEPQFAERLQSQLYPVANGMPSGDPEDVLTGFLDANGRARGPPVGVAIGGDGALLVADDVGNTIWRVTPSGANSPKRAVSFRPAAARDVIYWRPLQFSMAAFAASGSGVIPVLDRTGRISADCRSPLTP